MTFFRAGIPQYHPLQRILWFTVFSQFKMQVIAGYDAGMPDIADRMAHADIVSLFHVQFT